MTTTTDQPAAEPVDEPAPEQPATLDEPAEDEPTPGHPEAIRLGCSCPPFINGDGHGIRSGFGERDPGSFVTDPGCRLHGTDVL